MRQYAVFGYGALGHIVYDFLLSNGVGVPCIIDNSKKGSSIITFGEFKNKNYDVDAVIVSIVNKEIVKNIVRELRMLKIVYGWIPFGDRIVQGYPMGWDNILWSDTDGKLINFFEIIYDDIDRLESSCNNIYSKLIEIQWGQIYNNTIRGSSWLEDVSVSPGRWAVGYNFLYVLYRILNEIRPIKILELGFGCSSKLTMQYTVKFNAEHLIIEHDSEWVSFYSRNLNFKSKSKIEILSLKKSVSNDDCIYSYKDFDSIIHDKYDLILIDGPFTGDGIYSRRDILSVFPHVLNNDFIVLWDDFGHPGIKKTIQDAMVCLDQHDIRFYTRMYRGENNKDCFVLCSSRFRWVSSL